MSECEMCGGSGQQLTLHIKLAGEVVEDHMPPLLLIEDPPKPCPNCQD